MEIRASVNHVKYGCELDSYPLIFSPSRQQELGNSMAVETPPEGVHLDDQEPVSMEEEAASLTKSVGGDRAEHFSKLLKQQQEILYK